ncbi:MAG: YaiO family outer membrane beta-barrel protein [Eudoraea sp.]|nr:YaiO family outer membrane beta-barrel protein [Eudoraea sp.]
MNDLKNTLKYICHGFFLCSFPLLTHAQEISYTGDPDVSLQRAMTLAFEGNRVEARDTLTNILAAYPDYTDVRSLLAKTYSWDGNYEEARKQFNRITSEERQHKEVWIAAIRNEMFAENFYLALGLTNKALLYLSQEKDLVQLRSEILKKLEGITESPVKAAAKDKIVEDKKYKNTVALFSSTDVFDVVYDPMFYTGLEFIHETSLGKIIPRINYSNRFDIDGIQYEIDLYPKFSKSVYAYLNYGYSKSEKYPTHRFGGDLYANLPKGIEASLGARYLSFTESNVTIYTGSIGLYKGNYYLSLRPYVTPRNNNTTGLSGILMARKYLKDANNYIGFSGGMGFMPEFRQFLANSKLIAETVLFVESQQLMLEYQFSFKGNPSLYRANLGMTRQELVFAPGNYFYAVSAGLRYQVRF